MIVHVHPDVMGRVLVCQRCRIPVDVIEVGCGPLLEPDRFVCERCHVPVRPNSEPEVDL